MNTHTHMVCQPWRSDECSLFLYTQCVSHGAWWTHTHSLHVSHTHLTNAVSSTHTGNNTKFYEHMRAHTPSVSATSSDRSPLKGSSRCSLSHTACSVSSVKSQLSDRCLAQELPMRPVEQDSDLLLELRGRVWIQVCLGVLWEPQTSGTRCQGC